VAATTAICRISKERHAVKESEVERLRQRLHKMSNPELLLFGVTTKCQCSSETGPPEEASLVQLNEGRKGWKRRNPSFTP
jgi:hypothetical protein